MAKKQDLNKVEIPTGQFKHSMADPQFGRLVPADFEELTGLKVPEDDRYSFFACSC